MKTKIFLRTVIVLLASVIFIDQTCAFEVPVPKRAVTYRFLNSLDHKLVIGTLKLEENRDHILAVFEGTKLARGKYQIIKSRSCSKSLLKRDSETNGLLAFETRFGEISTEKKLMDSKFEDLNLEQESISLVKIESNSKTLIACGISKEE